MSPSEKILQSWHANAGAWVAAIDGNDLESRVLVTNDAIMHAILELQPQKVLDIGCGEGWLCRALQAKDIEAWGIDAVPQLVEKAIVKGGAFYKVCTYEIFAAGQYQLTGNFDAAVFNFSLLDETASAQAILYLPKILKPKGHLVIQTLDPSSVIEPQATGWKEGSWNGMKQTFVQPYNWYYRTIADWQQLFNEAGFQLLHTYEPQHPHSGKPLSIIFVLQANHA